MKRFLPWIAVGLAAVLVVAGVVVLAAGDGPQATKVGTISSSQRTVDGELAALRDDPQFTSALLGSQVVPLEHALPADASAGWLTVRVLSDAAELELARRGESVTKADKAAANVESAPGWKKLPTDFQHEVIDRVASIRAMQRVLLDAGGDQLTATAQKACPSGRFVSHILVATEAEAQAIKRSLDGGGDFAKLAQANSTDGSAADGGQLGCLDSSQFVEPFATVAGTQPLGVVSDPVQTQYGYHLILVTDQPSASDLQLATIAQVLALARDKRVTVDDRYGTWDARQAQVVPPSVPGAAPAPTPQVPTG